MKRWAYLIGGYVCAAIAISIGGGGLLIAVLNMVRVLEISFVREYGIFPFYLCIAIPVAIAGGASAGLLESARLLSPRFRQPPPSQDL
jgi:hypothetical protein